MTSFIFTNKYFPTRKRSHLRSFSFGDLESSATRTRSEKQLRPDSSDQLPTYRCSAVSLASRPVLFASSAGIASARPGLPLCSVQPHYVVFFLALVYPKLAALLRSACLVSSLAALTQFRACLVCLRRCVNRCNSHSCVWKAASSIAWLVRDCEAHTALNKGPV